MLRRITSTRMRTLASAAGISAVVAAVSVAQTTLAGVGSSAPADVATTASSASSASGTSSSTTAADVPNSGCLAGTAREDAFHLAHGERWIYDPTLQRQLLDAVRADHATPTADGSIDCDSPEITAFLAWARGYTAGNTAPK